MIRKSIHTVEEVLSEAVIPISKRKSLQNKKMMDGDLIRMDSHRYWTFKKKGICCVECGIEGKFFAKEKHIEINNYHFNLYAVDVDGIEVLMTKDHIIPKSRGGSDHIDNYQPMCRRCNKEKGNKMPHEYNGGRNLNCILV